FARRVDRKEHRRAHGDGAGREPATPRLRPRESVRLNHGDAPPTVGFAEGLDRGFEFGRVVTVVVHPERAPHFPTDLEPAAHAAELVERFANLGNGNSQLPAGDDRGQRVSSVVLAADPKVEYALVPPPRGQAESDAPAVDLERGATEVRALRDSVRDQTALHP